MPEYNAITRCGKQAPFLVYTAKQFLLKNDPRNFLYTVWEEKEYFICLII